MNEVDQAEIDANRAEVEQEQAAELAAECPGHPCEDAADHNPHAGIGETFYCDGTCQA